MLKTYYHFLIAGLPDLHIDATKVSGDAFSILKELKEIFSTNDMEQLNLILFRNDINSLTSLLEGKSGSTLPTLYSIDDLNLLIEDKSNDEILNPKSFEDFLKKCIYQYRNHLKDSSEEVVYEDVFTRQYYDFVLPKANRFIYDWLVFDRNIRNLCVALNAVKFGFDLDKIIIAAEDDEFALSLITNKSSDFGLSNEYDYVEPIVDLFESNDFFNRDYNIDMIRWKKLEESIVFDYFTAEVVYAYYLKLMIVERWLRLDKERGRQLFEKLANELKSSYELSKEL